MKKYGKSFKDIFATKQHFFTDNKKNLDKAKAHALLYNSQPIRENCMVCNNLIEKSLFSKNNVKYLLCANCGHLNGERKDTDDFCKSLYSYDEGKDYARNYYSGTEREYKQRVKNIYTPKVGFLKDALHEEGIVLNDLSYLDLGAGSGYFVHALIEEGVQDVVGYEISKTQVDLANRMIGRNILKQNKLNELNHIVKSTKQSVLSLIGVIEHLQNPLEILESVEKNSNIKYVYFSVPLFSSTVFFETVFQDNVMPRHLTGGHTHLYTESSIQHMENTYNFQRASEWWFGTDIMDLYRSVSVLLGEDQSKEMNEKWSSEFLPLIDDLQLAMDRQHKSSQVHILWKKI